VIRVLTIVAAVAALAVSAAPVGSAHTSPFDLAVFNSAGPSKSPSVKGLVPANVPVHDQPLLRRSADKALATGQHIPSATLTLKPKPKRLAEEVTEG
jgi:hypothetical protein